MSSPPPPPPPGFGGPHDPSGAPGYGAPGYGAPGYGAPGYGAPGYPPGYGAPGYPPGYGPSGHGGNMREHPDATTILVLGIVGLVVCQILSPIAWVKGNKARKEMAAQPGIWWSNRGNVTAGWICGIIGTVFMILGILFFVFVLAVAGSAST